MSRPVPFSPPDISDADIEAVVEVLRSGWITTGPQCAAFEEELSAFCGTARTVVLSSATAALELTLRALGVGPGDEVITSAYTYTASASVIDHVGARIVLVDTLDGSYTMDAEAVASAMTPRTKAVIAVDLAGVMYDHGLLRDIAGQKAGEFRPSSPLQEELGRVAVIADAAHSVGATSADGRSGTVADFTCFSFHAVKNLTTAEGGAVTWRPDLPVEHGALYRRIRRNALHGQTKDALAKTTPGAWEYDIAETGYKANMTDIQAALGRRQLARYPEMMDRRHEVARIYGEVLQDVAQPPVLSGEGWRSSAHLYMLRVPSASEEQRNRMISDLASQGISTNVHYKPLPLFTAYRNLGFRIEDFPRALDAFQKEITLPLYSTLADEDASRVAESASAWLRKEGLA